MDLIESKVVRHRRQLHVENEEKALSALVLETHCSSYKKTHQPCAFHSPFARLTKFHVRTSSGSAVGALTN